MNKIKLIHVGLGRWGFDWAQHVYPRSHDVEPVAYVDKDSGSVTAYSVETRGFIVSFFSGSK
jgi:hypothetical protein